MSPVVSATTVAVVTASDCSAEYLLASLRNLSASDKELALSMSNNDRLSLPPVLLKVNSTEAESVLRFRSLATGFMSTVGSASDFSAIVGAAVFVSDSRSVLLLLDEGTLTVAEIDASEISLGSLLGWLMGFSATGDDTIAVARMGEAMIDDEEVGDVGDGIVKEAVSLSSSLLSSSLTEVRADGVGGALIVYDAVIWFVLLLLLLLLGCSADPVGTLSQSAAFIEGTRSFTVAEGVLDVVVAGISLCWLVYSNFYSTTICERVFSVALLNVYYQI